MERYVIKNQKRLRCGITTGTCAAAAAGAAASLLLNGVRTDEIRVRTPKGITVSVRVYLSADSPDKAEYMVIKDSGDDPDVTNGAEIYASVARIPSEYCRRRADATEAWFRDERYPNLYLDGGEGVGRVTKEGLEQAVGQAAINTVPRSMIFGAVGEVCALAEYTQPLLILIRIPAGRELAARTFNPRLGIEGGLSVLGTSGILEPMSEQAILGTIEAQIRQLQARGVRHLLVTPGNYGQSYAQQYLHLDMEQSVKCSNYIGDTLDLAVSYGMKSVLLVGNIGKLVKLAAGIMNTHSRVADGRGEIMAVHAAMCGADAGMVRTLMQDINTEQMLEHLTKWRLREPVIAGICGSIQEHLNHRTGSAMRAGVILFSESLGCLGQTEYADSILSEYRKERSG